MLSLNISKFHHPSGYRKTFNRKCFCCFMVCTCDRRIRRTAHQLIELDGRHSKSLNLMVCPPNRGIPRSVLQIRSRSSSITISSTSINVRSKRTSRNSTLRHEGIFIFSHSLSDPARAEKAMVRSQRGTRAYNCLIDRAGASCARRRNRWRRSPAVRAPAREASVHTENW